MTCPNTMAEWYLLDSGHVGFEKCLQTIVQLSTMLKKIPEGLSCQLKDRDNRHHVHILPRLVKEMSIIGKLPMITDSCNNHKKLLYT